MTIKDAIFVMKLYNEKVDQLFDSKFVQSLDEQWGALVNFEKDKGWDSIFVGPEGESLEALILTLRLFAQKKERLSFCSIQRMYGMLPLPNELKKRVDTVCSELDDFLASDTPIKIEEQRRITHRELFDIFVYGSLAHIDDAKHKIYADVSKTPFFPLFRAHFVDTIVKYLNSASAVAAVNVKAMKQLEQL